MTAPALQPHPQDKYCTEKCDECCEFSLINGNEIFVCMKGGYEVIPVEIDLTPGVGQSSPFENTTCEFQATTHTSPPAQGWIRESFVTLYSNKLFTVGEVCNLIEGHRAEVAKAAREQVLDAIDEWLNSDDHLSLYKWEVREKIRSLRSQQEAEQPKERPR